MDNEKTVELENEFIVIAVPSDTVEIEIRAKVWKNGNVINVGRTMSFDEVRNAMKEARDGYIPSNALFVLNPNADKSQIEELVSSYLEHSEGDNAN